MVYSLTCLSVGRLRPSSVMSSAPPSKVLHKRLREVRRLKGWTQQDLAEALGRTGVDLSAFAIARMEGDNRGVSLDEAIAISAVLDVSPLHTLVPLDNGSIRQTPQLEVTAADVRA
jgi:transcriptional regulator with XRE-family HTH domain